MIRKSKEMKMIITNEGRLVFVQMKEDLFVCHVDMGQWVRRVGEEQGRGNGMKIEEVEEGSDEELGEMKWN